MTLSQRYYEERAIIVYKSEHDAATKANLILSNVQLETRDRRRTYARFGV